jgi:hypothetical protein
MREVGGSSPSSPIVQQKAPHQLLARGFFVARKRSHKLVATQAASSSPPLWPDPSSPLAVRPARTGGYPGFVPLILPNLNVAAAQSLLPSYGRPSYGRRPVHLDLESRWPSLVPPSPSCCSYATAVVGADCKPSEMGGSDASRAPGPNSGDGYTFTKPDRKACRSWPRWPA